MFELIKLLDTVYRTISADLEAWFGQFPQGAAWNVFSDYCVGDCGFHFPISIEAVS